MTDQPTPRTASQLREQVIREITIAPGWNKEDATTLVDELILSYWPAAQARTEALDVIEAEPCGYCGSVNGETPATAYSQDPIDGTMLQRAIADACSLTNPRLSEIEWDEVSAFLPMVEVCPHPEGAMTSDAATIVCTRCGRQWSNRPLAQARTEALDVALALHVLNQWAGCVDRLIAVAPVAAVMDETGIVDKGHSTPPERDAIRAEARETVARWLARDRAVILAAKETP